MVVRLKTVTALSLALCMAAPGFCGDQQSSHKATAIAGAVSAGVSVPVAGAHSAQPAAHSAASHTMADAAHSTNNDAGHHGGSQEMHSTGESSMVLKGNVEKTVSPFIEHAPNEVIPTGTEVSMTLCANVNSEVSTVGSPVAAMVSLDLKDKEGKKVVLPGQWAMLGKVSLVENQKRGGRDGYIEIKFDKLISPDGKYVVPVDATVSTKDSTLKGIAKHVAKDSAYVGIGAFGGALASVQIAGIGTAISTYGISVGAGAAAGATLGAVAAARRKGKILAVLPGDEIKLKLSKPLIVPAFNPEALPSAAPPAILRGFEVVIKDRKFLADPHGDKLSRVLALSLHIVNETNEDQHLNSIYVLSDHNQICQPYASPHNIQERNKIIKSGKSLSTLLTFGVGNPKHKYRLVLLDRSNQHILSEVPIN